MNGYPKAVEEKAKKLAKVVERTQAGESLSEVCREVGLEVSEAQLSKLAAKYEASSGGWKGLVDGRFGHEQKVNSALESWLYERKEGDPSVRAPALAVEILEKFKVELSIGHINYLLRQRALSAPPGRPSKAKATGSEEKESEVEPKSEENAGIFFPGGGEARARGE